MKRSWALLAILCAAGLTLSACGTDQDCLALPCAMPVAIVVSVTAATTGTSVEGAAVAVSGATLTTIPCRETCHVPGTAGTYTLDVSAPGFMAARRTVSVQGTNPPCGCPTVVTENVAVALVPGSASSPPSASWRSHH